MARIWGAIVKTTRRLTCPRPHAAVARSTRILIIRLDRIGDMVLTSPLLRETRRAFPEAWITLVAAEPNRPLLERCPYVSEVLYLNAHSEGVRALLRRWRENTRLAWRHLLEKHFTHALLPRYGVDHYFSYHLLALSGASQRIGFTITTNTKKKGINQRGDQLFTLALPRIAHGHEVERTLTLLTALNHTPASHHLELWLPPSADQFARDVIAKWKTRVLIGVCPSAHELARDWPFTYFQEFFARFQAEEPAVQFLLFGGAGLTWIDSELSRYAQPHVENLTGRLKLDQTAALIAQCRIFVSVDTGLLHIAAASGVRIVEISGQPIGSDSDHPQSPARFGPWQVPHRVLQPQANATVGADERLIQQVSVEAVTTAVRELLQAAV